MEVVEQVAGMREVAEQVRCAGQRIGLVPTMGALHEGHKSLIRRAQELSDYVVTSIFVNPTQFSPDEDLDEYPRDMEGDRQVLEELGVDVLFAPGVSDMYPGGRDGGEERLTRVAVSGLDKHLCGAYRPGHFEGVTTIVTKLLTVVRPHVAVFGRKDAQQLVIIRRLVRDLLLGVEIEGLPIVREDDGLASSSRNAYLTRAERKQAVVLSQAVSYARSRLRGGEQAIEGIVEAMRQKIAEAPQARIQYVEVVDQHTLEPVRELNPGQAVIAAVAVYFGETRLIDNAFATVGQSSS